MAIDPKRMSEIELHFNARAHAFLVDLVEGWPEEVPPNILIILLSKAMIYQGHLGLGAVKDVPNEKAYDMATEAIRKFL